MAITRLPQQPPEIHRLPQPKYIDSIRWLLSLYPFHKSAIIAFFDADAYSPSLEIHSLNHSKTLTTQLSQWTPPSRISFLKSAPSSSSLLVAASTFCGSLQIFRPGENNELEPEISVLGREFHMGSISGLDLMEGGGRGEFCCVSVGEDGRVNLVNVAGKIGDCRRVFDGNGLVSYNAVRWASPSEFVAGGCGFGLQWWDLRQPGAPVAQFKGNWVQGKTSGIIHSIDIHTSRKHKYLAGGSSGTIFAWDLRSQQQPIILSGVGSSDGMTHSISENEVWAVQYDYYTRPSNSNISSRILPGMICSEDGILAVIEYGEEPIELLAEPCAINSFDIDQQNPMFGVGIHCHIVKGIKAYGEFYRKLKSC